MDKIKIIFLGTPEMAVPSLKALVADDRFDIQMVVTQPDKPVGRKGELTPPPVKEVAEEAGITVMQPDDVNQDDVLEAASAIEPDFIIVIAYGQILSDRWLDLAKQEILNIHYSLLPKYRGAAPIQASILKGDTATGISIAGLRKKLDSGPVYLAEEVKIDEKTASELYEECSCRGAELMIEVILDFENFMPIDQDDSDATYCRQIKRADGEVDFEKMDSTEIMRRFRAFSGWPGVFTYWDGKRLKLTEMEDGKIKKLQLEGKKEMTIDEFKRGYPGFEL